MLKYYIALFAVVGMILFYVFVQDPCSNQVRSDFTNKFPDYEILNTTAVDGTRERVYCHIYYEKPDSQDVYKDVWLYLNTGNEWNYSSTVESQKIE